MTQSIRMRPPANRFGAPSLSLLCLLPITGCAFLNRDNTPITNYVEKKLTPESSRAREALVPIIWPVAAVTLIADAVVIHPISVVDDAVEDTRDALWDEFDWDAEYATECFKLPWRATLTPIVFGFDFLGRALFDIPPHGHREEARAEKAEVLAEAVKLFDQGLVAEASVVLDGLSLADVNVLARPEHRQFYVLRLRIAYATGDYSWFKRNACQHRRNLSRPDVHSALLPVLEEILTGEDPFTRLKAFHFTCAWSEEEAREPYAVRQLQDPSPFIRFDALISPRWNQFLWKRLDLHQAARTAMEDLATDDPDPMIRALAAEIMRTSLDPNVDPPESTPDAR